VCRLPDNREYGPLDRDPEGSGAVSMTVEEYETVRLIDFEGMTQEGCAELMGVSRTTVQEIYSDARRKLATSLVGGMHLTIEGGRYRVCGMYSEKHCGRGRCRRRPLAADADTEDSAKEVVNEDDNSC